MRQRTQHGFTLIELAVVTAILGLLVAGAVTGIGALRVNTKIKETRARLDFAELSLQSFLARNGRLPCPADPLLGAGVAGHGFEHRDGSGNTCHAARQVGATGVSWGVLPFATLGVPPREMVDGWDNQIFYRVVSSAATLDSLASAPWARDDGVNEIELWDKASGDASLPARRQLVNLGVVALISAGANRHGAFTLDGSQLPAPPAGALAERENQGNDIFLVAADYSEDAAAPFDDLVRVLTEDALVQPLAARGELRSKRALTLARMERLVNLVYGYAITRSEDPDGAGPRTASRTIPLLDNFIDGVFDGQRDLSLSTRDTLDAGRVPYAYLGVPAVASLDAWGNGLVYEATQYATGSSFSGGADDEGIYSGNPLGHAGILFRFTSWGPDGVAGGGDDIVITHTLGDALGRLSASGVSLD